MPYNVVICFHFTIFVVLETTRHRVRTFYFLLWFAFILLSLSYWKQHWRRPSRRRRVVICFHFTIFVVLETTIKEIEKTIGSCDLLSFYYLCRTGNNFKTWDYIAVALWFAFILLSLSYWKQPTGRRWTEAKRCDLLSFYYLCRTGNNVGSARLMWDSVVICFHFTIFVVLETTRIGYRISPCLLWFAFILLSLSYWKQLAYVLYFEDAVVICFHFTIFVVLETTSCTVSYVQFQLWFAFILLSLSYWKQQRKSNAQEYLRCDLLSFYYLCRTGNNSLTIDIMFAIVVICFHFTIFVVLETTYLSSFFLCLRCDLLSFYYLCRTGNNK